MDALTSETSASSRGRKDLWILAAALLAFCLLAATLELQAEEDAFIYYRYALSWAQGHGLVFNAGDPVEGFSGPLWMGILAVTARLGFDLPRTAPVLGMMCGIGALLATWLLGQAVGLSRFGRLATVAILALSYPFIVWSRSGLETPLYSLAIIVATGAYLAAEYPLREDRRAPRWLGTVASLAAVIVCLGRPEGLLLVAILAADRVLDRRDFRGALRYALPAILGYGAYLVWRFHTFHSLVPNTSVKLYPLLIDKSASQLFGYVVFLGALPLALPVFALLSSRGSRPERRRLGLVLAVVGLLSVFFNFAAGGDYRPGFRYFIPTLPLLLVAVWQAFELLGDGEGERSRLLRTSLARGSLVVFLLSGSMVLLWRNPPHLHDWRQRVFQPWRDPRSENFHWGVQIALWLDTHAPQHSVVAFGQMGRVPYFLARKGHEITFIDTLGLVDRPISRIYRFDGKLRALLQEVFAGKSFSEALETGRRQRARQVADSILSRHPDFILIETALDEYRMMEALTEHPGFQASYRKVAELPPGAPPYVRIYARITQSGS